MLKLMHKKPNKKGFTLAELLVVVAVIAILVAIAIPIFTKVMENAQKKTNDANIRSTKAAAVTEILDKWDIYKDGADKYEVDTDGETTKAADGSGWFAIGHVDKKGDLKEVYVYTVGTGNTPVAANYTAVSLQASDYTPATPTKARHTQTYPYMAKRTDEEAAGKWIAPWHPRYGFVSSRSDDGYWTLVYISDVEEKAPADVS